LGSHDLAGDLAIISAALFLIAFLQCRRLARYAQPQIGSIANDPTAAYNVKRQFDAL
jgi:hypothetical protein